MFCILGILFRKKRFNCILYILNYIGLCRTEGSGLACGLAGNALDLKIFINQANFFNSLIYR